MSRRKIKVEKHKREEKKRKKEKRVRERKSIIIYYPSDFFIVSHNIILKNLANFISLRKLVFACIAPSILIVIYLWVF